MPRKHQRCRIQSESFQRETYQEEGVCQERVGEDGPANPAAGSTTTVPRFGNGKRDDDADELVAGVGDEVEQLALAVDAEEVHDELEEDDFGDHHHEGGAGDGAQQLGLEGAAQPRQQRVQQDVRHECHQRDVHVRAVDVLARRQEEALLAVVRQLLLARPGPVPPREQHQVQLVDHVAVRHVEVVLQRRHVDVAVELSRAS